MLTLTVRLLFFVAGFGYVFCNTEPSVIIIGAGASGIAAAARLLENGIENITILEAEDRIGGRINTVEFGGTIVDLGAQWCHGEENNLVYELVKDLDLLDTSNESIHLPYASTSHTLDEDFVEELETLLNEISDLGGEEGLTVGDFTISRFNQSIEEKYGNDPEKTKFAWDFLNSYKNMILSLEGAFSWFDPSSQTDYQDCEGDQTLQWTGHGYRIILDVLMKKYPNEEKALPADDKILLNKEVTDIEWDDTDIGVMVKCADNTEYAADHVIFTPSLGVLKKKHNIMFHPNLPEDKVTAIEELGIGAVMKVFLHFEEKFWTADHPMFLPFFWTTEDRMMLPIEFPYGPRTNGTSWLQNFVAITKIDEESNVLLAWLVGDYIPYIELISNKMLTDGIVLVLNKFLGHEYKIERPLEILRSSWYSNPHFLGTYSYQTLASRKREPSGEVALSQPLMASNGKITLLFAGEATNPHHFSTVHGAIETGFREADRILDLYK